MRAHVDEGFKNQTRKTVQWVFFFLPSSIHWFISPMATLATLGQARVGASSGSSMGVQGSKHLGSLVLALPVP